MRREIIFVAIKLVITAVTRTYTQANSRIQNTIQNTNEFSNSQFNTKLKILSIFHSRNKKYSSVLTKGKYFSFINLT